jgi:hypothetical protein
MVFQPHPVILTAGIQIPVMAHKLSLSPGSRAIQALRFFTLLRLNPNA